MCVPIAPTEMAPTAQYALVQKNIRIGHNKGTNAEAKSRAQVLEPKCQANIRNGAKDHRGDEQVCCGHVLSAASY